MIGFDWLISGCFNGPFLFFEGATIDLKVLLMQRSFCHRLTNPSGPPQHLCLEEIESVRWEKVLHLLSQVVFILPHFNSVWLFKFRAATEKSILIPVTFIATGQYK